MTQIAEYLESATFAGLTYASTDVPGITRRRAGKGFSYFDPSSAHIRGIKALSRIRALAIPPAWSSVWICPDTEGHIQAVGFDERGRRQYLYHARFREVREGAKFEHMMLFAKALPRLRRQVAADLATSGLGRRKVLAALVDLLETTMIRVGNAAYAKENKSYGLTTLTSRHVDVAGPRLRFHFKGKSGKAWNVSLSDRRVASTIKKCQELPGQHLFQYIDEAGERQALTSTDVNAYLKEVSCGDVTAKDFRTWAGTMLMAVSLAELGAPESLPEGRRNVAEAIAHVAARLGNTPTICRKCYVHPEIVKAYLEGALRLRKGGSLAAKGLRAEEAAVLAFLKSRTTAPLENAA